MGGFHLFLLFLCCVPAFITGDNPRSLSYPGDRPTRRPHFTRRPVIKPITPGPPSCQKQSREYYNRTYCPPFFRPCYVVRCPLYSCLETAFLKSEAQTRRISREKTDVVFRKLADGSTIFPSRRSARRGPVPERSFLGCRSFFEVYYGPGLYIFDPSTNRAYKLVEISAACGGPFYQTVVEAGCLGDHCCYGDGECAEFYRYFYFLVHRRDRRGETEIRQISLPVGCQCTSRSGS